MAIDPVFSPPSAPEPAPQRSRASDAQGTGQEFTLPERSEDRPVPVQDTGKASPPASQKAKDDAVDAPSVVKDGTGTPASKEPVTAKPADGAASKPATAQVPQIAGPKTPVVPTDIGALASILAAAEEAAGKVATGEGTDVDKAAQGGAPVTVKPGKKKLEDGTEAGASAAAAVEPTPTPPVTVDLAALLAAGMPAAEVKGDPGTGEDGAGAITAKTGSSRGLPNLALAATAGGQAAVAAAADKGAVEVGKLQDAGVGVADAAAQLAAKGHAPKDAAKVEVDPAVTSQANGPTAIEPKLLDNLQQALAPLDLSAAVAQAAGKAGAHPLAAAVLSDPTAAAGQPPAQGQANSSAVPTPIHVFPIEIGMRALSGARQFDIRLDPAELGRVDVNLSISDKGEVSAKLVVDRVETLHLLQRDARTLERAFEQAGLKPSDSGVDISLRDNSGQAFRQQRQQDEAPQRPRRQNSGDTTEEVGGIAAVASSSRQIVRLGGVDLSI